MFRLSRRSVQSAAQVYIISSYRRDVNTFFSTPFDNLQKRLSKATISNIPPGRKIIKAFAQKNDLLFIPSCLPSELRIYLQFVIRIH